MTPSQIPVSADGHELAQLLAGLTSELPAGRRTLLGVTGAPGAGKSTLAAHLAQVARPAGVVVVPMDGFHLADAELDRRGLQDRKGAPETFDGWGYAALLARLRDRPDHDVLAPAFERDLEQPLAGAIAVSAAATVVVAEGNYLLLDDPPWRAVRAELDAVWHVVADDGARVSRLVARHEAFGKAPAAARAWVERVDEPNARLVEGAAGRADLVLDLTGWEPSAPS
jgi:pantothenate kinase